jgi:hypothetical protein
MLLRAMLLCFIGFQAAFTSGVLITSSMIIANYHYDFMLILNAKNVYADNVDKHRYGTEFRMLKMDEDKYSDQYVARNTCPLQ